MGDFADTLAQVMQLHARYSDAIIREDSADFADCFAEDAEWRISGKILRGREEARRVIEQTFQDARRIYLKFTTPILDVAENGEISARTYMNERCAWKDGKTNTVVGRYFERFERDGERLRFSWRLWQGLYIGPADLTGDYYDAPGFGTPPGMPALDDVPEAMA